jgi:hypothetical protein
MYRRASLAMVAFAGAATLLAGCGSSSSGGSITPSGGSSSTPSSGGGGGSQTPLAELTSAVNSLGNTQNLTAAIKVGASASQIQALAKSNGSSFTSSQANTIAGLQVSIQATAPSGQTLGGLTGSSAEAGAVDFKVGSGGTTYLSVVSVNKVLYLQVDLKDVFSAIGKSSEYSSLSTEASALPSFAQALLSGKWVSLPLSTLKQLEGSLGANATATPSTQQQQKLIASLQAVLTKDVTVTRTSSGGTDNLTLTANSKTLANDFLSAVGNAVPAASSALSSAGAGKVTSQQITMTAQVSGGSLTQLSIDVGQFDKKKTVSFPLVVTFTKGGSSVSAPSGAVPVDTSQLQSLVGAAGGGL